MQRDLRSRILTAPALAAVVSLPILLSACGDDSTEPASTVPDTTLDDATADDATADDATADRIDHPVGATDVVVQIEYTGGFLPRELVFSQVPGLVVTGDGHRFVPGPRIEIYPGPLLPDIWIDEIGESGIQGLLALAAEHGLLAEREYDRPDNIADAPDTVVTISAEGATYAHRAYALGIGGPGGVAEQGARADLLAFVEAASVLDPDGGEATRLEPTSYLVQAWPVDDPTGGEVEPTVVEWPAGSVSLTDASVCVEVPAAEVGALFTDANQLTFFADAGVVYQVAVKPAYPGVSC